MSSVFSFGDTEYTSPLAIKIIPSELPVGSLVASANLVGEVSLAWLSDEHCAEGYYITLTNIASGHSFSKDLGCSTNTHTFSNIPVGNYLVSMESGYYIYDCYRWGEWLECEDYGFSATLAEPISVAVKSITTANRTITYLHADTLGSPILETDELGEVVASIHYKPFGATIEPAKDGEPGYTAHVYDGELELNYMQARYYDPVIGRFYSNDPVGFGGHLSGVQGMQGFNRYAYVNNNPY